MFAVEIGGFWHYMLKVFLEFLAILAFLAMIAFATRPPHPTIPTCLALRLNWPRHSGLPWSDPISGKYLQVQTMQWYLITRWGVRGQCNTITPPSAEPSRPLANLFITLIVLMASVQAMNTRGSTNRVHIVLNRFHKWVHAWLSKKVSKRVNNGRQLTPHIFVQHHGCAQGYVWSQDNRVPTKIQSERQSCFCRASSG